MFVLNTFIFLALFCLCYFLICRQIDYYITTKDPLLDMLKEQLSIIHPKFNDIEVYAGERSYTINKKRIYICLKDEYGRYYNRNMLVYVLCHEFAHVLCDEVGHTKRFFEIFHQLLRKAESYKLYDSSIPPLEKYCGVE